jgi:exosome complex component RRP4
METQRETKRRFVLPGDRAAEGNYRLGEGLFKEGDVIYASVMGLLEEREKFLRVIPLVGRYIPKEGDYVIGIVATATQTNWDIDIDSAYNGILNPKDYTQSRDTYQADLVKILHPGEALYLYIREISPRQKVYVTMTEMGCRHLSGGKLITVAPPKVPRIIGRKRSMIKILREESGCEILVGQNGRIWLNGTEKAIEIAERAIRKVEAEAHTSGLTDKIKEMIITEREQG